MNMNSFPHRDVEVPFLGHHFSLYKKRIARQFRKQWKGEVWKLHAHWHVFWLQPALWSLGGVQWHSQEIKISKNEFSPMVENTLQSKQIIAIWLKISLLISISWFMPCCGKQCKMKFIKIQHLVVLFFLVLNYKKPPAYIKAIVI